MVSPRLKSCSRWSRLWPRSSRRGVIESTTRRWATSKTRLSARSSTLGHVLGEAVAQLGDLARHRHQAAEQGVLLDDPGVVLGVADRRRVGLQRDEHRRVADHLRAGPRRRSSSVTVTQSAGSPWLNSEVTAAKMWPWDVLVEVLGLADLHGRGDGVPGQQHRPEQRLLRLEVVRRDPSAEPGTHRGARSSAGSRVVEGAEPWSSNPPRRACGG